MKLLAFGADVGPQQPLVASCECSPDGRERKLPIWVQTQTADAIGRQLAGVLRSDLVILTYRCRCGRKIVMTVADLFPVSEGFREAVNGM